MGFIKSISVILIGLQPVICLAETAQHQSINADTGAVTWETHANGVTFSLTQILPNQARAFYVNRGFTLQQIEPFATSCIYMTVLRNDKAADIIHFTLQDWSIVTDGHSQPPINTDTWVKQLKKNGATNPALIAFHWAQFPSEQSYEPGGDWNQGMMTTGLPAGNIFDVIARWDMNNKQFKGVLHNVRCAK